jgi:dCTP deaminase
MILSGLEIESRQGSDIIIEPYNKNQLNPNSYNLKLHNELLIYKNNQLDMKKANEAESLIIPEEGLLLESNRPLSG